jgi:hypothetical protein
MPAFPSLIRPPVQQKLARAGFAISTARLMICIRPCGIDLASKIAYTFFTFLGMQVGKAVWVFIQYHAASPHGK